ncbi:MAG TPA: hypothetical protein VEU96_27355 [Bryobacteraceae bacterium]|nr:hypothetical protein [Bryobacteraceae bacterium]
MKITRDVIDDLLPAYFSGEASSDTKRLVEEYFRQDPAFERESRRAAEPLRGLSETRAMPPDLELERIALKRTKRLLRVQTLLLALASTFSLNAVSLGFSFEIGNGYTRVHWLRFPGQLELVVIILALALVFWALYLSVRGRVRTKVLG